MPKLMIALDVNNIRDAYNLVELLPNLYFKVGLELIFTPGGREFIKDIRKDHIIMLDVKMADIPTTNVRAVKQIMNHWDPDYITVRTGWEEILTELEDRVFRKIVYVPKLTSDEEEYVIPEDVLYNVKLGGVVCSARMAKKIFNNAKSRVKTFVPGIRPLMNESETGYDHHPNKVATDCPEADFIIIGRPITRSDNPREAMLEIKRKLNLT